MSRGGRRAATRGDEMPKYIDRNFWSRSRRSSLEGVNVPSNRKHHHNNAPNNKHENRVSETGHEDDLDSFDNTMNEDEESLSLEDDDAEEMQNFDATNGAHRKKILYHQIGGTSMRSSLNTTFNEEEQQQVEEGKNLAL
jgi:hypothetical protein